MKKVPALYISDVSYSVNGRRILDSINWTVYQGEHWAVLGPNGAGKTTLLKIACGYIWPNEKGTVYRKGQELVDLRELRKSIGWVTSTLPSQIPAREKALRTVVSGKFAQIGLVEGPWGKPARRDYAQAERYLREMGCAYLKDQEFGTLSQGEQQMVLIARARMTRPYLIFLDEPCAGMDPGAREGFLAVLGRLGKQKRVPSLIYVTHHIEEIVPIFRKMLILKEGRVLASGSTRALLKPEVLRELYKIPITILRRNGRYWPVVGGGKGVVYD